MDVSLPVRWFAYAWRCKGPNRIHSPFVFDLYFHHILDHTRQYYAFDRLKALRNDLQNRDEVLQGHDPGAGSRLGPLQHHRKIRQVARQSLLPERELKMLFRVMTHLKPKAVLELGTSLGLTTLSMNYALPYAQITTVEGHQGTAAFAEQLFQNHQAHQIRLLNQTFETALQQLHKEHARYDAVFFDGDHRYDAVIDGLRSLKPLLTENAFVIVDDIRWSAGMYKAWKQLEQDAFWEVKIDLGNIGMLIRRPGQTPQQFVLRYPF